nr:amidohydrolase family protein [Bacteroidota bacterium]
MKKLISGLAGLILIILIACNPMKRADLIVHNAKIYTVDDNFSMAEAMVVSDGKIVATGSDKDILSTYNADEMIDLAGKPVYPGFIDAHCHFYSYGLGLLKRADLKGTESFEEILEIIKAHQKKFPSAYWIEGRGWDQNDWAVKEFPTKERLDELFPDNPVMLTRIDGHAA